jgi:hypothetical protein
MALDVQWLLSCGSASQCLLGALRNGFLWTGDTSSACMGAVETPLPALSCVTAWQSDFGSYAAAAGQSSNVLLYGVRPKAARCPSQGQDTGVVFSAASKKKKRKKVHRYCIILTSCAEYHRSL